MVKCMVYCQPPSTVNTKINKKLNNFHTSCTFLARPSLACQKCTAPFSSGAYLLQCRYSGTSPPRAGNCKVEGGPQAPWWVWLEPPAERGHGTFGKLGVWCVYVCVCRK